MMLGVIGCGKMGMAMVEGALEAGVLDRGAVVGCDPISSSREAFEKVTGHPAAATISGLDPACDAYLLCTKPQDAVSALELLAKRHRSPGFGEMAPLVISIAAGLKISTMEMVLGAEWAVVRAMPNTPALVGAGAAAFCGGGRADPAHLEFARSLFGAVGLAFELPEALMNAVTGLSGSGPAYVFLMIEALADGAVRQGIPREQALKLAAQTVRGAAEMVLRSNEHPAVLRDRVTSPGGTTAEGLAALEMGGVRAALIDAVRAASQRADELG